MTREYDEYVREASAADADRPVEVRWCECDTCGWYTQCTRIGFAERWWRCGECRKNGEEE